MNETTKPEASNAVAGRFKPFVRRTLTDTECDEYRQMSCSFNDMLREVFNDGKREAEPKIFSPDWDRIEAMQESLREHMLIINSRDVEILKLKERIREMEQELNRACEYIAELQQL